MKLTSREITLAWLTMVVVVLGITAFIGTPKFKEWRESRKQIQELVMRKRMAERVLQDKEDIDQRLQSFRDQLPQYPEGRDVTSEMLKNLEKMAQKHGVALLRRDPSKERQVGDLYEVGINCRWEGDLESVVHFLYDLQSQGAILDIRELNISPSNDRHGGEKLKGSFTVDYAYTRGPEKEGLTVETEDVAN